MKEFIDKTSEQDGTPINRENLMAVQGFVDGATTLTDGVVTITNTSGETITILPLNVDGETVMYMQGEKDIKITSKFTPTGIVEVLS